MEKSDKNLRFSKKDKKQINSMKHKQLDKFSVVYIHRFRQFYVNLNELI